jgi:hypothetical protein
LFPLRLLLVVAAAGFGCGNSEQPSAKEIRATGPVLARGAGWMVTAEDLSLPGDPAALPPRDRQRALDAAIARKLAAAEAQQRGLDQTREVAAKLSAVRREAAAREEALLRDALFASLRDAVSIPEGELRAQYEKTKALYTERRLVLRRQTFPSESEARAADAALGSEGRLEPARSEALAPAGPGNLPPTVLPEALKLRQPGERTLLLRDGSASLVELVAILPAEPLAFDAVREQLEGSLRVQRGQEAFRAEIERLRADAKVEVDEAALSKLGATGTTPARSAR